VNITVAVPTVGRSTVLETLGSIARQTRPPDEVLVVNQGDLDEARTKEFDIPIRQVNQMVRGVARARNRALEEFGGDWLLFTDDDQLVNAEWVEQLEALVSTYPDAAFFGGAVLPPLNFDRETCTVSQLFVPGEIVLNRETYLRPMGVTGMLTDVWGGNYALSRRCVETVGLYDEQMGRGSGNCEAGEDTDYILRALTAGLTGVLSCRMIITHTYGARPESMAASREPVEVGAMMAWKATHDRHTVAPELASRLHPFGRKKAVVGSLLRGQVYRDHSWRREVYDSFWRKLETGFCVVQGRTEPR